MYHTPNHRRILTSLALVVLIALLLCISGAKSNSPQATGYEYRVISRKLHTREMLNIEEQRYPEARAEAIQMTLNKLGKEGWDFMEMNESFFILKRKLR